MSSGNNKKAYEGQKITVTGIQDQEPDGFRKAVVGAA